MILIVGLGNPGEKYKRTRHNVGFMVLDEFKKIHSFSDWQLKKKFKAEISEGTLTGKKIILAKPQTFMNESGKAVKIMQQETRDKRQELYVIHDDLDLGLGKMKIVQNRGSAGHKGVQSIINEIGNKNFIRFRIGIKNKELEIQNIEDFVLKKFTKDEKKVIKETVQKTCKAIEMAIKQGIEKTMSEFNK
ncbi:aminoacyl-tRNA hydrolase [Candidatus Parcubacteria bacterium]|nr:aminoacyl-tRNA hydrolase [Candidatus Parcubacteria bacterium]